ncbi:hypothetical protein DH2020_047957 [Rehmannia glutinosa]|uniref:BHLH domain-containing protein n=1 Tax=Rehmannia glutinosa TaxID=99300 RepID=A0ABR0U6Z9_REHGL
MALSYYSNWGNEFKYDTSYLAQAETGLVPPELYNDDFVLPDGCFNINIDNFLEPNDVLNDYEQLYSANLTSGFQDYYPPEVNAIPALPEFPSGPPIYNNGGNNCESIVTKPQPSGASIAARQRRRKISEKTGELGKLIPGGHKMNTAEMFQAAYKYIKFLQAQVGILEFMGSCDYQEKEEGLEYGLIESPLIQEKLYSTEKCLVPRKFVQELANDDQQFFESKPHVMKEVKQILN